MFSLEGKVAIVTGASKGIGKSMAYALGKAGAKVVISSRSQESLDEVAKEFSEEGIEVSAIAAHAGKRDDNEKLIKMTVEKYGTIDVLINNAAVNPHFGGLETIEDIAYQKIMDVNLKGPLDLAKFAFPFMKAQKSGSIINISSVEGHTPSPGLGMYSVSKAALIMLTKSMAKEWSQYGIRTNAICPGLIQTKFSEALWTNDHIMKSFMHHIPMNRIGQPDELSGLALFLASSASSYCTGGIYTVDGGYLI